MARAARPKTRAQELGASTRKLRNLCLRRIRMVDQALIDIAGLFGDLDMGVVRDVDDLRDRVADFHKSIGESCAYLDDVPEEAS